VENLEIFRELPLYVFQEKRAVAARTVQALFHCLGYAFDTFLYPKNAATPIIRKRRVNVSSGPDLGAVFDVEVSREPDAVEPELEEPLLETAGATALCTILKAPDAADDTLFATVELFPRTAMFVVAGVIPLAARILVLWLASTTCVPCSPF